MGNTHYMLSGPGHLAFYLLELGSRSLANGAEFGSLIALMNITANSANIWQSAPIIAVTTFVLSLIALFVGTKAGEKLGDKAEILGGIILIIIGIKSLF